MLKYKMSFDEYPTIMFNLNTKYHNVMPNFVKSGVDMWSYNGMQ